MRRRSSRGDEQALGCVVHFFLIVFLMPIVGIYLLCKPNSEAKLGGAVLLVVGLLLWLWLAVA